MSISNTNRYLNAVLWVPFIIFIFVLTGCGGNVQPLPVTVRVVPEDSLEERVLPSKIVPRNNCGGSTPMQYTYTREEAITKIMELGFGTEVSVDGKAQFATFGEVNIGGQISAAYNTSYGSEITLGDGVAYEVQAREFVEYKIAIIEYWQKGTIIISNGVHTITDTYKFREDSTVIIEPTKKECPQSTPTTFTPTVPANETLTQTNTPVATVPSTPGVLPTIDPAGGIVTQASRNMPSCSLTLNRVERYNDEQVRLHITFTNQSQTATCQITLSNSRSYISHNGNSYKVTGFESSSGNFARTIDRATNRGNGTIDMWAEFAVPASVELTTFTVYFVTHRPPSDDIPEWDHFVVTIPGI